jgi:NTE family protein
VAIECISGKRLTAQGKLDASRYKDVLTHRIDGGELLEDYNGASKVSTNSQMIHKLRVPSKMTYD